MWKLGASRICSTSKFVFTRDLVERLNATLIAFADGHKIRIATNTEEVMI